MSTLFFYTSWGTVIPIKLKVYTFCGLMNSATKKNLCTEPRSSNPEPRTPRALTLHLQGRLGVFTPSPSTLRPPPSALRPPPSALRPPPAGTQELLTKQGEQHEILVSAWGLSSKTTANLQPSSSTTDGAASGASLSEVLLLVFRQVHGCVQAKEPKRV